MTEPETPNQALQRTPGFGVQLPSAALIRPAQSRAVRPAMKPGTARAFALRRRAHSRAPGPESLSLGSLGVATRLVILKLLSFTLALISAFAFGGEPDAISARLAQERAIAAWRKGQQTGHCLLHNREMLRKHVRVVYGDDDIASDDTIPAMVRIVHFPHAREYAVSSKAGQKRGPKTASVFICVSCQEAEMKWKQDNPK